MAVLWRGAADQTGRRFVCRCAAGPHYCASVGRLLV